MVGRALVIGSQIAGLRGVRNDVSRVQDMLGMRGFDVETRAGAAATRAGILDGHDRLIAASRPDDAAVIYYSGLGFLAVATAAESRVWNGIVPIDMLDSRADDWRGITAWELSIKHAQLATMTRNVTVILDTCYVAQMSRNAAVRNAVVKAFPYPIRLRFSEHLEALRAMYGTSSANIDPIGNPNVVRLAACGIDESAYEYCDADGNYCGVFTDVFLEVLHEAGAAAISWAALGDVIRTRVARKLLNQRPIVEGPGHRQLFSLGESSDMAAIRERGDRIEISVGRLSGVAPGDVFGVMPAGSVVYDSRQALARVRVVEVLATGSTALRIAGDEPLPPNAVAIPLSVNVTQYMVVVDAPVEARAVIERAIAAISTLRVAASDQTSAIATLRVVGNALQIEDAKGPLFLPAVFPAELHSTLKHIINLGMTQSLREVEGEHGVSARELDIEMGLVENGLPWKLPDHGAALGLRDRLYVKVVNKSQRQLYGHIFNLGLQGQISLLTNFVAAGVALRDDFSELVLGREGDMTLTGLELTWPVTLPRSGFPRIDEILVIITSEPTDLRILETLPDRLSRSGEVSRLADLFAQLRSGRSRGFTRGARGDARSAGYLVKRLSFLLHPLDAAMGHLAFEIDENPSGQAAAREPDAWLRPGVDAIGNDTAAAAVNVPDAIAIKIVDLVVDSDKTVFAPEGRIDALICTRSKPALGCYTAWTQREIYSVHHRSLSSDGHLVFQGPVRDVVDIALFVSRDRVGSPDLAHLFAERVGNADFKDAVGTLQVTPGSTTALIAAVGGSAVLARIANQLLTGIAGASLGLYRTSFLRRENFGVGRHPVNGVHHAQGLSFALVIEPIAVEPNR